MALRSRAKRHFVLYDHILWGSNVLPPIIVDAVLSASHPWKVVKPPFVMSTNLTSAPFIRIHCTDIPFEIGEV